LQLFLKKCVVVFAELMRTWYNLLGVFSQNASNSGNLRMLHLQARANACVVQPFPRPVRQESANTTTKTIMAGNYAKLQSADAVCTNALLAAF
jgi:hypothetical protein